MVLTRDICEEIKSVVNQVVSKYLKTDTFIDEISKKVSDAIAIALENRLRKIEESVAALKNENEKLENKLQNLQNNLPAADVGHPELEDRLDRLDQSARSCNLRIFNFKEKADENVKQEIKNILNSKIHTTLTDEDILLCYRVGKKKENKHRGILIKLKNTTTKQCIFTKKRLLKGTGIVVKEDLTNTRLKIMNKAIDKLGVKNVWSENGKIFCIYNENVHVIDNEKKFSEIFPF